MATSVSVGSVAALLAFFLSLQLIKAIVISIIKTLFISKKMSDKADGADEWDGGVGDSADS